MIEKHHSQLSVRKQCKLLDVNRNRLDPRPPRKANGDEAIKKEIDRIYTEFPFYGSRKILHELHDIGIRIGRKRCRRLMRAMGIEALVPKPSTSTPDKQHKKYPYLLRECEVSAPDEVWAADITYVPMYEGHVYLVAIMDWHTRAVLSWRVSTTMDAGFCVEAYRDAVRVAGRAPSIMNTDQGSQFTGEEWIEAVESSGARVSMDGKGRWMDNVFIERLWRSLKYEELRLWSYGTVADVAARIAKWMGFYNHRRKHQALHYE
ncbi:MAG: IS3 family transposase, partial [Verrucomicrobiota bacterium]